MISAEIVVEGKKDFLKALFAALKPEAEFKTQRASYYLKLDSKLKVKVQANDATAFRAVINTLTGLMAVAEKAWKPQDI